MCNNESICLLINLRHLWHPPPQPFNLGITPGLLPILYSLFLSYPVLLIAAQTETEIKREIVVV